MNPLPKKEPLYIRPYVYKQHALLLRHILFEAAAGYAPSNPRVKLYEKFEAEIADHWPDEALR